MAATLTAPPAPAVQAPLTPEDLLALEAEHGARYELVNGELQDRSELQGENMPNAEHGAASARIVSELVAHVRADSLGVVLVECGFVLSEDPSTVRIPDVSFVASANMPGDRLPSGYFRGGPDLAVEVVSPHEKAGELAVKTADYLAAGTQQVWIVELTTRTVAVYRPGGAARVYGADDTLDGGDLLPGLALPVGDLFDYGVAAPDTNSY